MVEGDIIEEGQNKCTVLTTGSEETERENFTEIISAEEGERHRKTPQPIEEGKIS